MEKAAFEELYMNLYPGLYRLAQGILRQEADAQELQHLHEVELCAAGNP